MVADGILSWLTFAGIPHAAIDTDWQHHTLSDRYKSLAQAKGRCPLKPARTITVAIDRQEINRYRLSGHGQTAIA